MKDQRPDPKPRKYPQLWQAYLYWEEIMKMKQRHTLRLSSIERGKSNLDGTFEKAIMDGVVTIKTRSGKEKIIETFAMDAALKDAAEMLVYQGGIVPVWEWITSIKGLGSGAQAAKVLALIDDIGKFDTISKLWRYSGYGLYEYYADEKGKIVSPTKGKRMDDIEPVAVDAKDDWDTVIARDRGIPGFKLPYNKTLKSTVYIVGDGFIKQQTLYYTDIYYDYKRRQRKLYPEKITENGKTMYNDGHLHYRAMRRMVKEFLKDLWVEWRKAEGLPVTERYGS